MVTTYRTREEKTLAVIQALAPGHNANVKTFLVCEKEKSCYDIDDMDAEFIFLAIENNMYVVKKHLKKEIKNHD